MSDRAVLIFAKSPLPGRVKTRLIPSLGAEGAVQLYTELLMRQVAWITDRTPYEIELWTTPERDHPTFLELADRYRLKRFSQSGPDLGIRMQRAAQEALGRHRRVILIGVDCPALSPAYLEQAFCWLDEDVDAVLGPAEDGGYVLLGLKCSHPSLFHGHAWGERTVAATTRDALRAIGWRWRELPELWDLDRPDDLTRLRQLGIEMPSE